MARKRKERGRQLRRILRLVRKLEHSRSGLTIEELGDELDVGRRTVYRDLRALEEAGFRLETSGGDGTPTKWRFTEGQRRSLSSTFTENELLSLYFCLNVLAPLKGTPLRDGVESLLDKIESAFGAKERERYGDAIFTHVARLGPTRDYRRHGATMSAVSHGCLDRKKVEVTYRAAEDEKPKAYLFHPYCLVYSGGEIYTVGYSELRKALRTLRIDRIERIALTDRAFERPREFDAEDYVLRGFGMYAEGEATPVRIEFRGDAARSVREKEWHPTQQVREKPGGRIEVRMRVQGLSEVARWVLHHAPNARVLEPAALARTVREWAEGTAKEHE